ncbi:MAG: hypothetical protein JW944_00645 [Deltaproteobacteria bacterium]|nr:hypothetical protein [Deltaproteobacteria bacterium]
MEKTGISRATLNNYIKLGIIPRPIIRKPVNGFKNIKSLGYFPRTALDRIEEVRRLKKEGISMDAISGRLSDVARDADFEDEIVKVDLHRDKLPPEKEVRSDKGIYRGKLKVTLKDISFPAYLINFDFEIAWINHEAEERLFNQKIDQFVDEESINIFKLLFNWEFHCHVQNWKDLVAYHMSFAKFKYSKTWLTRLYQGISGKEVSLLEKVYDDISTYPDQAIKDTHINFLKKDGSTDRYRVYSVFFEEGIFFVYVPF